MRFDSKFEKEINEKLFKNTIAEYHSGKYNYTMSHTYTPDWIITTKSKTYLVECKGWFRNYLEASKYLHIRCTLDPKYEEILFIFQNPTKAMPKAKIKRNYKILTMSDWAEKHGFKWYTNYTFPKELLR